MAEMSSFTGRRDETVRQLAKKWGALYRGVIGTGSRRLATFDFGTNDKEAKQFVKAMRAVGGSASIKRPSKISRNMVDVVFKPTKANVDAVEKLA